MASPKFQNTKLPGDQRRTNPQSSVADCDPQSTKVRTAEELQRRQRVKEPFFYCRWIVAHPKRLFFINLSIQILMFVISGVLVLAEYDLFPTNFNSLPISIFFVPYKLREYAYESRDDYTNKFSRRLSDTGYANWERGLMYSLSSVDLYFDSKNGNLFSRSNLQKIKQVEDDITAISDYRNKFCVTASPSMECRDPVSVLRYFDGTYININPIFNDTNFDSIPSVLYEAYTNNLTKDDFTYFLPKSFTITSDKAEAALIRSIIPFGCSLSGDFECGTKVKAATENFLVGQLKDKLESWNEQTDSMDIFYYAYNLWELDILNQAMTDMLFAIASIVFIFCFMLFHTRSLWISGFAIMSIISSFLGGNLIYRVIIDFRYFGFFHVLSIFIILGIGADDLFVFYDAWRLTAFEHYPTVVHRLSDAYSKSAFSMFITSLTTIAAFLCSALSPLLATKSFGIFTALVVFLNYLSVITFFPTVIIMHHLRFENWKYPCCKFCNENKADSNTYNGAINSAFVSSKDCGERESSGVNHTVNDFGNNNTSYHTEDVPNKYRQRMKTKQERVITYKDLKEPNRTIVLNEDTEQCRSIMSKENIQVRYVSVINVENIRYSLNGNKTQYSNGDPTFQANAVDEANTLHQEQHYTHKPSKSLVGLQTNGFVKSPAKFGKSSYNGNLYSKNSTRSSLERNFCSTHKNFAINRPDFESTKISEQSTKTAYLPGTVGHKSRDKQKVLVAFFRDYYFKFATHKVARWCLLAVFVAVLAFFAYSASKLEPDNENIKVWKDSHNYRKAIDHQQYDFLSSVGQNLVTINIIWGLKNNDRSSCHFSSINCRGTHVYDDEFDPNPVQNQKALMDFCDKLYSLSDSEVSNLEIKRDSIGNTEIACFTRNLQSFLNRKGREIGVDLTMPLNWTQIQNLMATEHTYFNVSHFDSSYPNLLETALQYWMYNGYDMNFTDDYGRYNSLFGEEQGAWTQRLKQDSDVSYGNDIKYIVVSINTTINWFTTGYTEGIPKVLKWESFVSSEVEKMPKGLQGGFQTVFLAWHWFYAQKEMEKTAVLGIAVGVSLAFPILCLATMNVIVGGLASVCICCTTVCVIGVIPLVGWKLGLLTSLNMCMLVGLAVDYVVHLAEGYVNSLHTDRLNRTRDMLESMGISVFSGACTTLGASLFMFFTEITFYTQFGVFLFCTIGFSMFFSLGLFTVLMGLVGPQGNTGSLRPLFSKLSNCISLNCGRKSDT